MQCQKIHAASFVTWVGFNTSDCKIDDPDEALTVFNTGAADRSFCKVCGSHILFRYTRPNLAKKQDISTYFSAANITQTDAELDDALNEEAPGDVLHIYTEQQPSWTKDFVQVTVAEVMAFSNDN